MNGICVAVNATTLLSGWPRYATLKLWKSRPAAPMIRIRRGMRGPFRKGTGGFDTRAERRRSSIQSLAASGVQRYRAFDLARRPGGRTRLPRRAVHDVEQRSK